MECATISNAEWRTVAVLDAVRQLPEATTGEWWGQILGTKDRPTLKVRIVAMRKSQQTDEKARKLPAIMATP